MEHRTIHITENDLKNLREAIRKAWQGEYRNSPYIQYLEGELERAVVVPAREIPADVITMNSRVRVTDLANGEQMELWLVYPEESGRGPDCVSVLAPIGTAMIGYRVGDVFEWDTPAGKTRLKVERILYQPEQDGAYD